MKSLEIKNKIFIQNLLLSKNIESRSLKSKDMLTPFKNIVMNTLIRKNKEVSDKNFIYVLMSFLTKKKLLFYTKTNKNKTIFLIKLSAILNYKDIYDFFFIIKKFKIVVEKKTLIIEKKNILELKNIFGHGLFLKYGNYEAPDIAS